LGQLFEEINDSSHVCFFAVYKGYNIGP